jgi:hypothetical protein
VKASGEPLKTDGLTESQDRFRSVDPRSTIARRRSFIMPGAGPMPVLDTSGPRIAFQSQVRPIAAWRKLPAEERNPLQIYASAVVKGARAARLKRQFSS